VWYSFFWQKHFEPLTRFISLRSIKLGEESDENPVGDDELGREGGGQERELIRRLSTVDEDREKGLRFVNPSLVVPLEQPWIYKDPPPPLIQSESCNSLEYDVRGTSQPAYANDYHHQPEASQSGGERNPARTDTVSSTSSSSVSLGDTHIWRE